MLYLVKQQAKEPDWWYDALQEFSSQDRLQIEKIVAPPSEQLPLSASEINRTHSVVKRYLERQRFVKLR